MTTRPFWLDWEYDGDNADTGTTSRYGNYLRMNVASFREIWADNPSVEFAAVAWRIATGPVMSPPLVRSHPRILGASVGRSTWNGELVADVELVSPRPAVLANARTPDGRFYGDATLNAWGEYEGVGEEDLSRGAYLLTSVRLLWQLPAGIAPRITRVPTGHDEIFRQAVECLKTLVWALNREVGPIIEELEQS